MRWFKRLVEVSRTTEVYTYNDRDTLVEASSSILDMLNSALVKNQPFIFSPTSDYQTKEIIDRSEEMGGHIDAPFTVFSYEISGNVPITFSPEEEIIKTGINVRTWCVVVIETAPTVYEIFSLIQTVAVSSSTRWTILHFPHTLNSVSKKQYNIMLSLTEKYLTRVSKEKAGVQKVKEKLKIGVGKSKHFSTIKKVIHITPKKNISHHTHSEGNIRDINWTHRWSVRGHWMKTKGVGKDREGNYCVEGFTWRNAHIKGPEEMPLVKKQRLVQN